MSALPGGDEGQEGRGEPHPRPQPRELEPHHPGPPLPPPLLGHAVLGPHHAQPAVEHHQREIPVVTGREAVAAVVQERRVRASAGVGGRVLFFWEGGGKGVPWRIRRGDGWSAF